MPAGIRYAMALLISVIGAGDVLADKTDDTETLRYFVVESKSRPFQLEAGEFSAGEGIITEIVNSLVTSLPGLALEPVTLPVIRLQHMVSTKQASNWILYNAKGWHLFDQEGRFLEVPLFEVNHSLATCDPDLTEVTSIADLTGTRLTTLEGFVYPELESMAARGELTLLPVDTYLPGFKMVTLHRANGFVEMDLRLKYNALTEHIEDECLHYVNLDQVIPPYDIYLQVDRRLSDELFDRLEQRLLEMKASGQIERILSKYQKAD